MAELPEGVRPTTAAEIQCLLSIRVLMAASVAILGYNIDSIPACGSFFFARVPFWAVVMPSAHGYVHPFGIASALSCHSLGRACEVTLRVSDGH